MSHQSDQSEGLASERLSTLLSLRDLTLSWERRQTRQPKEFRDLEPIRHLAWMDRTEASLGLILQRYLCGRYVEEKFSLLYLHLHFSTYMLYPRYIKKTVHKNTEVIYLLL